MTGNLLDVRGNMSSLDEDVFMVIEEEPADQFSDYGSEFGEEVEHELAALLGELESRAPLSQEPLVSQSIEDHAAQNFIRMPPGIATQPSQFSRGFGVLQVEEFGRVASPLTVQYDDAEELARMCIDAPRSSLQR